jgi:adenylate cyclase
VDQRLAIRLALSGITFLVFAFAAFGALHFPLLDRVEQFAYDARLRLTATLPPDPRVVIVDIDEPSIAQVGRWPWARDRVALLLEQLTDRYQVAAVGFDIVFAEPDDRRDIELMDALAAGPLKDDDRFLRAYAELKPSLATDQRFAQALAGRKVALGYVFQRQGADGAGLARGGLPAPVIAAGADTTKLEYIEAAGYTGNLAELQAAARSGGFFDNPLPDEDQSFRRIPLVQRYQGAVYESLSLATLRVALGAPPLSFAFVPESTPDNINLEGLTIGDHLVPVDDDLAIWIPFRGGRGSFPYVPVGDVLRGTADAEVLRGAIVLVGTTAPGLQDLRPTPLEPDYPGVELHANVISAILDGRYLARPAWVRSLHVAILLASAIVVTLCALRLSIGASLLVIGAWFSFGTAVNLLFWTEGGLVVPMASPIAFVIVLFFLHSIYGFLIESRRTRLLSSQFGHYLAPELVAEMAQQSESYTFEGQTREMTVLFLDARDFTSTSEGLSPLALSEYMNTYLTAMTGAIQAQRGTVDKYIGDAIMAFWGAPVVDAQHARHAVLAGMEMARIAERLNAEFAVRGWPPIHIGIGISTGEMRVGDMGSSFRRQYTVMGDAVNLGSRLEGLTKEYGVVVLVSEATVAAVPEVAFLELDRVRVKGRAQAVAISTPLGLREGLDKGLRQEASRFANALAAYRAQRWDDAEREFFGLSQAANSGAKAASRLLLDRIAHFKSHPPSADWDGVFTFRTK